MINKETWGFNEDLLRDLPPEAGQMSYQEWNEFKGI